MMNDKPRIHAMPVLSAEPGQVFATRLESEEGERVKDTLCGVQVSAIEYEH
jgi:hypothetical protein